LPKAKKRQSTMTPAERKRRQVAKMARDGQAHMRKVIREAAREK
jgi:hypothetical protein